MVYSTCSMCPLENEAVVAELMMRFPGALKIVDVSKDFVELDRRPGLTSWHYLHPNGDFITDRSAIKDPKNKSFLPPKDAEGMKQMGIEHCMRVYPHMQDTGGFFIAVLEKVGDIKQAIYSWQEQPEPKVEPKVVSVEESKGEDWKCPKRGTAVFKEEPFVLLDAKGEELTELQYTSPFTMFCSWTNDNA